ncbi:predicted protein [Plenodomus lingam JN3]|uniref:Predicted protein n=1 Tax=Leptosphaeria maculans (strain JN3 / isolate v23.1.3 / race Av1-4-5-6-7-8) TaxID=985895 RepID=E4ZSX1_LEPMJ|nr:predicted protein [Plenodomus lingam JN3]CBX94559.1 predicted protein [Plenodomus lingam JN3]
MTVHLAVSVWLAVPLQTSNSPCSPCHAMPFYFLLTTSPAL